MDLRTDGVRQGTDDLDRAIAATAPPVVPISQERAAELSRLVARQVVEAERGMLARLRSVRRRHRAASAALTAAIVFVPGGAWAAQHFLAQTGEYGTVQPGMQDDTEFIDMCAKDFADYVVTLAPTDLPAPPGHTWAEYAERMAKNEVTSADCDVATQARQQESQLRHSLVAGAASDWGCELVWANRDGDRAAERNARTTLGRFNAAMHRISPESGGGYDPDVVLSNSRLPQFVGCER